MQEVLFMFGTSRENAVKVFDEIRKTPQCEAFQVCQMVRASKRDKKIKSKESFIAGSDYDILKKSGRLGIFKSVLKSVEKYGLSSIPVKYRSENQVSVVETTLPGIREGASILVILLEELNGNSLNMLAKMHDLQVVRYQAAALMAWSDSPQSELNDESIKRASEECSEIFIRIEKSFSSMNQDHNRWHWHKNREKKLILVTSPPASGKTYISKQLSKNLKHVVYLDKDSLIPLSNRVFICAGEEINRSSEFFEDNIRDAEYDTVLDLAFEALEYDDFVLINAPFAREIRNVEYINQLKERLAQIGARLVIVWVNTSIEVCKQRMIDRNSDRDTWKLANWDEYVSTRNFNIPEGLDDPAVIDDFLVFENSSEEEFESSMKWITYILEHY